MTERHQPRHAALLTLLAAITLAGCAQVGPVLAPSAGLPQPPLDFTAVRRGPNLVLHWTAPTRTSDGEAYRASKLGALHYRVCAWPGKVSGRTAPQPATIPKGGRQPVARQIPSRMPNLPGGNGRFATPSGALMPACAQSFTLPGTTVPLSEFSHLGISATVATLALGAENGAGDMAGWSNPVVVPLTPVASPPVLDSVQATAAGVRLRWRLPQPAPEAIVVYRQHQTQTKLLARLPAGATEYLDRSPAWNQPYQYWLRSAAGSGQAAAESADSARLSITPKDVFPPPVPTGLQAVVAPGAGGAGGVDLSWNATVAPDLAGYNVYRRLSGQSQWQKRNKNLLLTPVFHDSLPPQWDGVEYAVTAVDQSGNESARGAASVLH